MNKMRLYCPRCHKMGVIQIQTYVFGCCGASIRMGECGYLIGGQKVLCDTVEAGKWAVFGAGKKDFFRRGKNEQDQDVLPALSQDG